MFSSYLASHFLSPNGYLAYALNFDAFTSKEQQEQMQKAKKALVRTNFMDLMMNRIVMQSAMNMSASRSYASSLTSSLNKDDIEEGVIYFNSCVNMLFMGLADTKYNREKYPQYNSKEWLPLDKVAELLKMWASGGNRPDNGGYVGFRTEGKKGKIVFPEYY
jgi:hypothetical protein